MEYDREKKCQTNKPRPHRRTILGLTAALCATLALPTLATAEGADFAGDRINIMVPFAEGGAADGFARILAHSLPKYLAGGPQMVVTNLPGAGSIAGTNRFERDAKPDGMTLLAISTSTLLNYVVGADGVEFKPEEWIPILIAPLGAVSYVRSETGVKADAPIGETVKILQGADIVYGDSSPQGGPLRFLLSLDMLGISPRTVWGLSGGGPRRQAFQRNEFQINYESALPYRTSALPLVEEGIAVPFFTFGMIDQTGEIGPDPLFPDVPTFLDAYRSVHDGNVPDGIEWKAWRKLYLIGTMFNKALFLPKDTPDAIVAAYTQALTDVFEDEEFLRTGGQELAEYSPLIGPSSAQILKESVEVSSETIEFLSAFLQRTQGVGLTAE